MPIPIFSSQLVLTPFRFWSASGSTPVRQSDLYGAQIEPLIGAGAVAMLARSLVPAAPFWLVLTGGIALAYLASLLTSSLTPSGRRATREMWDFARRHRPARFGGVVA